MFLRNGWGKAFYLMTCALLVALAVTRLSIASNLGDTWRGATLSSLSSGTAEQPYVRRVLAPWLVGGVISATPDAVRQSAGAALQPLAERLSMHDTVQRRPLLARALADPARLYDRLLVVLFYTGCMAAFAFAMYRLALLQPAAGRGYALAVPLAALALVPLLASRVTYLYDASTLLLSAASFAAMIAARWRWYYLCFALACLNKESSLCILVLFGLWWFSRMERGVWARHLLAQLAIYAAITGALLLAFADNPGVILKTDYQRAHLAALSQFPGWEVGLAFAIAAFLLAFTWRATPAFLRSGLWLCVLMWIAYLLFGKPGEYRVFCDVVPLLALLATHMLAATISAISKTAYSNEAADRIPHGN